ncbi:MAG TPA: L,D-transpeptidase [Iamia sp.]|nr:L,D-transpeptidase [Iamia sp.]
MGDPDHAPGPDPAPAASRGDAPALRRLRRRTRRVAAGGVVVLIAVAVGVAVAADEPDQVATTVAAAGAEVPGAELEGSWATTTTSTTTTTMPATPAEDGLAIAPPLPRPWTDTFLVADATGPGVALFSAPDVPVPSGRVMENPSWEGLALTFLVRERTADWLHVQLMSRPNSALAWIKRADVTLRRVQNHIVIEREARRITVFHGEEQIYQASVATGKAESPTPLGTFFVDGVIRLSPPHKAYGTGQLSFTGFSEVYESFGGGIGQVAMHGTQNPALIGTPASHGCVRMRNEDIDAVTELSPTGTPVEVIA